MKPPKRPPVPESIMSNDDEKLLNSVKNLRNFSPEIKLMAVQLTQDQKPEDPEETARIVKHGGEAEQQTNEKGDKIGPFRVWHRNENYPGLAMSRSIGDRVGKQLGVTSEPVLTEYRLSRGSDYHIIVASDGVWDVMTNQEVVDFVEANRND